MKNKRGTSVIYGAYVTLLDIYSLDEETKIQYTSKTCLSLQGI